jgi:histidinol-phosphate aminotransferase
VAAALNDLAVETWPSDANFILFRPLNQGAEQVWKGLLEHSVLVRNCAGWDGLPDCLRVTIGTPDENDRFLNALKECL